MGDQIVFSYNSEEGVIYAAPGIEKIFPSEHRQLLKHSRQKNTLSDVGAMSCNRREGSVRCKKRKKRGDCPRESGNVGVGRCACDKKKRL